MKMFLWFILVLSILRVIWRVWAGIYTTKWPVIMEITPSILATQIVCSGLMVVWAGILLFSME